jgi:hypothetical protein
VQPNNAVDSDTWQAPLALARARHCERWAAIRDITVLRNVAAVVLTLGALVGCAVLETSEATHMLNGKAYPPLSPDAVVIYLEKPNFEYITVGLIDARGIGLTNEARDQELAVAALKREAASIGANGVVITESRQQIAGVNKYGTSTERRIRAIAIRKP